MVGARDGTAGRVVARYVVAGCVEAEGVEAACVVAGGLVVIDDEVAMEAQYAMIGDVKVALAVDVEVVRNSTADKLRDFAFDKDVVE